ncbi:hypothetical protein HDU97_009284 [Phlyctochytrium planicorne]|nr:hypothetical protein HDU97_009284 [Phlyctochytrium planicorne]
MFKQLVIMTAMAIGSAMAFNPSPPFAFPYGSSDVSVLQVGDERGDGFGNVTVALAVRNKAFQKSVGVRFTTDGWNTYSEAFGTYRSNLANGFELWGLTIPTKLIENAIIPDHTLAAFTSYSQAPRVWDPKNNYYSYGATPANPLAVVGRYLEAISGNVVFSGSLRTFSSNRALDYKAGAVVVRWSIDGGKTNEFAVPPPSDSRDDTWSWKFLVANATAGPLPGILKYSFGYKSITTDPSTIGLGVQILRKGFYQNLPQPYNGLVHIQYVADSAIPITIPSFRIDNGQKFWGEAPDGTSVTINTSKLSNGNHTVTTEITLKDGTNRGPVVATETFSFTVENKIQPVDQWFPEITNPNPTLPVGQYALGTTFNEKVYLALLNGTIAKFNQFGDATPAAVYVFGNGKVDTNIVRLAVSDKGVFALTSSKEVYKFDEVTGGLDAKFGTAGSISIADQVINLRRGSCYPTAAAAVGDFFFVYDYCGYRVLKYSAATGAFLNSYNFEAGGDPVSLTTSGANLLAFSTGAFDSTVSVTTFDPISNSPIDTPKPIFTRSSNYIADISFSNGKYAFLEPFNGILTIKNADGAVQGKWIGDGGVYRTLGKLSGPTSVFPLADGTFAVVDRLYPSLQRFAVVV